MLLVSVDIGMRVPVSGSGFVPESKDFPFRYSFVFLSYRITLDLHVCEYFSSEFFRFPSTLSGSVESIYINSSRALTLISRVLFSPSFMVVAS